MISFKQFLTEADGVTRHPAKESRFGGPKGEYTYAPKKFGDHTVEVTSNYHVRTLDDGSKHVHHGLNWSVVDKHGYDNYDRGKNKALRKHGLAVWAHVHRAAKAIINHAKEHNEVHSVELAGNSRSKRQFYRRAAERLGKETGAKRVTHDDVSSVLWYK